MDEILTAEEVAGLLKLSVATVRNWSQDGTIPCHKLKNEIRYNRDEVMALVGGHPEKKDPVISWLEKQLEERRKFLQRTK